MHLLDQTAALIEWMTFKQTNIKTKRVNCTVKIDLSTWSFYRKEAHQMHSLLSFYCCWWFSLLYLIISIRFILHFYAQNNDKFFGSLYRFIVGWTFFLILWHFMVEICLSIALIKDHVVRKNSFTAVCKPAANNK